MPSSASANHHPAPTWASRAGFGNLKAAKPATKAGQAADRFLIAERVGRYGWGVDERNEELLADCFTSDAVWEGSIMGETAVGTFTGRGNIVRWMADFWAGLTDQRRHSFSNIVIDDLTRSTATVSAYLTLLRSSESRLEFVTAGPYRFYMTNEGGVWRINQMIAGFDVPF